ncbi:MAG: hypothetical protein JW822_14530 [Spirochaetales bacterium]|nr:hypothetical protein [Spirochaetales bacterium]
MRDKILIIGARSIFILGVFIFALAVFMLNHNEFALSSLKAERALLDMELEEKYKATVPPKPVDFSGLIPEPVQPPDTADAFENEQYETALKEYEARKKQEQEDYAAAQKEYDQLLRRLDYEQKLNAFNKSKEAYSLISKKRELDTAIRLQESRTALVSDKYVVQLIGTILILIGAAGILILGENWERAALLVFLGFAFRTLVGL